MKLDTSPSNRTDFIVQIFNKINIKIDKSKKLFINRNESQSDKKMKDKSVIHYLNDLVSLKNNDQDDDEQFNKIVRVLNISTLNQHQPKNDSDQDSINQLPQTQSFLKDQLAIESKKCYYCGFDKVVKCNDCSIYFCNGKGNLNSSHIFHHLIRAHHHNVDLNLKRVVGNQKGCNVCDCRNIFNLGILSSSKNNLYFICRPPCKATDEEMVLKPIFENYDHYFAALYTKLPHLNFVGLEKLKDDYNAGIDKNLRSNVRRRNFTESVNITKWKPLVTKDKILIHYIKDKPNVSESIKYCKSVTGEQIENIEKSLDLIRNPEQKNENRFGFTPNDLIKEIDFMQLDEKSVVLLSYENGQEYKDVFYHLLRIEKNIKRLSEEENIGEKIVFKRMVDALDKFACNEKKLNEEIYEIILGKKLIENFNSDTLLLLDNNRRNQYRAPNLAELNESQALAVKHALEKPFTLIQGPPGTGKTHTSATIVYNLFKNQSSKKKEQILVCAPSNIACDHLAVKIKETNLNVIRLLSRTKENDRNYKSPLSVHNKLKYPDPNSELNNFREIISSKIINGLGVSKSDYRKLFKLEKAYENEIINQADVVVVTCVGCADLRLKKKKFKYLLIDEVAQSTEPEVLIPLTNGAVQKLILIGDIQQLSPVIKNRKAIDAGFHQSLMERLTVLNNSTFLLNTQYRMHPILSKFSSENFYNGLLKNGVTESERILINSTFEWPSPDKPTFFFSCNEEEQLHVNGFSYLNCKEGSVIGKLVYTLINSGINPNQIGIITPYEGQRAYLRSNLKFFSKSVDYDKIEIASINAYQGREKDIIILSTVRSNSFKGKRSIGFLSDTRRLNVALTRAKYALIIVGNEQTLCNEKIWYDLLKFYQDNNLIVNVDGIALNCNLPKLYSEEKSSKLESIYHIKSADNNIEKTFF